MIEVRKSEERGQADHGWLSSRFTFSFAEYFDPRHMQFRALRVINEDHIAGGGGFPTHPHRDMEIITYVISGAVAHRDSSGGSGIIKAGELQHMTAGTGVHHSEFNASPSETAHLLQIWLLPEKNGLTPSYSQTALSALPDQGPLTPVAANQGGEGTLRVRQDVQLFVGKLEPGARIEHFLAPGRHAWLQLISGALEVNSHPLKSGDGAAASEESALDIRATEPSHFLLFDLA